MADYSAMPLSSTAGSPGRISELPRWTKMSRRIRDFVEIHFFQYVLTLFEDDPLSPPKGEAAQGGIPLTPLFFGGFNVNLLSFLTPRGLPGGMAKG
jgi:hypothetical protein